MILHVTSGVHVHVKRYNGMGSLRTDSIDSKRVHPHVHGYIQHTSGSVRRVAKSNVFSLLNASLE